MMTKMESMILVKDEFKHYEMSEKIDFVTFSFFQESIGAKTLVGIFIERFLKSFEVFERDGNDKSASREFRRKSGFKLLRY